MPTLTQIIADAYRKMVNPPQAVARPNWVPASVNEESVPAFVQAVTEARKANQSVVEFNGKKYGITVKEETNKEDDNKSKKIQDMDAENAPKQGQEEAPEEVKEEDSEEIKVANVADKEKDAEEMQKIAASEAPGDKRAEMAEELVGNQHKLDVNKNGKIDAEDLKKLRGEEKEEGSEEEHPEPDADNMGGPSDHDADNKGEDDDVEEAKDWTGHVPIDWTDHGTLRHDVKSKLHGVTYRAGTTFADWRADHPTNPKHHAAAVARVKAGGGSYRGGDAGYVEDDVEKNGKEVNEALTGEQVMASVAATYASMVNENDEYAGDNPVDKLHLDVPAFIRVLEKAREDFKTDEDIHNFTQQLLAMKSDCIHTDDLPASPVKEGTSADAEAGPEVMDPVTQKAKDDADDETEIKDGVPGAAQDGSDKVTAADKPAPANSSAALPKVPVITAPVTTNESTEALNESPSLEIAFKHPTNSKEGHLERLAHHSNQIRNHVVRAKSQDNHLYYKNPNKQISKHLGNAEAHNTEARKNANAAIKNGASMKDVAHHSKGLFSDESHLNHKTATQYHTNPHGGFSFDPEHSSLKQTGIHENAITNEGMTAIVTRKNSDGSYDEVGMSNKTVVRGSHSNILKKAKEYAKGPHRVELFHGDRIGHGSPHKVIHSE